MRLSELYWALKVLEEKYGDVEVVIWNPDEEKSHPIIGNADYDEKKKDVYITI